MNQITGRIAVVAALAVASVTAVAVPSAAVGDGTRLTIEDRRGAPGQVLREIERLAGQPLGDLDKVVAVDTGDRLLRIDQLEALVAGKQVEGVKVLGSMPGRPEMLDTTLADLADGEFDGRDGGAATNPTLLFATSVPDSREWCLTMCVARGKSVFECILARLSGEGWLTLEMPGTTTLGGLTSAFGKAGEMSNLSLVRADTYVGEEEATDQDLQALASGQDVSWLHLAATVDKPSPDWALEDVPDKSGVVNARTKILILGFDWMLLGHVWLVCISKDGGKHWKCRAKAPGMPWTPWK